MNYGASAVRHDMGSEARIRVSQFYGIPGSLTRNQLVEYCFVVQHAIFNFFFSVPDQHRQLVIRGKKVSS
jgi:hypothetical protein